MARKPIRRGAPGLGRRHAIAGLLSHTQTEGSWLASPESMSVATEYARNILVAAWKSGDRQLRRKLAEQCFDDDGVEGPDLDTALADYGRFVRRHAPKVAAPSELPGPVGRNLRLAQRVLGLGDVEREFLQLAVVWRTVAALEHVLTALGELDRRQLVSIVRHLLCRPEQEVEAVLATDGRLSEAGLVEVDVERYCLAAKVEVDGRIIDLLHAPDLTRARLEAGLFAAAPSPSLRMADFAHLDRPVALVRRLLGQALEEHRPGINVLLFGPTGVGKTELARCLAAELGAPLYEAGTRSQGKEPLTAQRRLASAMLAQRCFAGTRSMVLFDELEDAFVFDAESKPSKLWFNRLLEQNPVPTVWISNDLGMVDEAFLRRFTYSVEMREVGASVRRSVLQRHLGAELDGVDPKVLTALVDGSRACPGQLASAVRASRLVGAGAVDGAALRDLVAASDKLVSGHQLDTKGGAGRDFSFDVVSASVDLEALVGRLVDLKDGCRLLCAGVPGTGKTEYGRHVARRLDRPLHVVRPSDVLSKYVGESEQNVAALFARAREEDAVLLLDEVDTFLYDRGLAQRSWEVSLVNEFLQQIERFEGHLVATTNRLAELDPAVLRRFDFKVEFGYPTPDQCVTLFARAFEPLLGRTLDGSERQTIRAEAARLGRLTPGEFPVVARRARMLGGVLTPERLLGELAAEVRGKPGARGTVGF